MTNPVKPRSGVGVWFADLMMGFRFAVAGGRSGWIRAGLTALGVSLAVAMLLVAAAVPTVADADRERQARQAPVSADDEGEAKQDVLLMDSRSSSFRDTNLRGELLQATGPDAPIPPGLDKLPAPGEMYVSPALRELLDSPEGELVKPRVDFEIVGTIGDEGLRGPGTLQFFAGSDELDPTFAEQVTEFGVSAYGGSLPTILMMLILVAATIMLLPVVMFMAVAVRFGGERRDRRLAALRLVGADQAMTRRVAAGESLLGALVGLALGWLLFELGTMALIDAGLVEFVTGGNLSFFSSDLQPDPVMGVLVVLAVPVVSVVATQLSMRRLMVEPLGVVRNAKPTRRRLWWRLLLTGAGVAALLGAIFEVFRPGSDFGEVILVFGVLTLLLGVAAILPWVVERVVGWLRGGSPGWQLATRRLQLGGGSAFRAVVGVAVAVAGAIALQMLFTAIQDNEVRDTGDDPNETRLSASSVHVDPEAVASRLADIDGVEVERRYGVMHGMVGDEDDILVAIADCDQIATLAKVDDCSDGDVFGVGNPPVGKEAIFWSGDLVEEKEVAWRVPEPDATVELTGFSDDEYERPGLIVTPAVVPEKLRDSISHTITVTTDPAKPDAVEQVRNVAASQTPTWFTSTNIAEEMSSTFAKLRYALLVGVVATMSLIGLSLLVTTIEQLQERRRIMSVLVAFGARRRSLILSVLWQTAIPVVLALVVSTAAGLGLGQMLVSITVYESVVDWSGVLAFNGAGAAMVLLVTLLSLPPLWRMMRPDGIRTE